MLRQDGVRQAHDEGRTRNRHRGTRVRGRPHSNMGKNRQAKSHKPKGNGHAETRQVEGCQACQSSKEREWGPEGGAVNGHGRWRNGSRGNGYVPLKAALFTFCGLARCAFHKGATLGTLQERLVRLESWTGSRCIKGSVMASFPTSARSRPSCVEGIPSHDDLYRLPALLQGTEQRDARPVRAFGPTSLAASHTGLGA